MRPGRRLVKVLLALAGAALFVPFLPELAWLLAGAAGVGIIAAGIERILLGRVRFSMERAATVALPLDEHAQVELWLRTDSLRPVRLHVRQLRPERLAERATTREGICRPGEVLHLEFNIRGIERGSARLAPPFLCATFWGLAERITQVGTPAELHVIPNLGAVRRLHRQLNRFILRGLGNRVAPRMGKGREFDRLREYVPDDDFRDIAWKASARHQKLIAREFRLDRSQDVLVCVDRGHRMAARVTYVTRLDHAVNAAVLIGYICNRMEDRVGMLSFGAQVEQGIGQGRGAAHLRRMTAFATGVRAEFIHTDYAALAVHLRQRLRRRTLILMITALPEKEESASLLKALHMLTPQHLPFVLVLSDPQLRAAAQFLPSDREELCRRLVARDLWMGRRQVTVQLRRRGAFVVETPPEDAGIGAVNGYLEVKRRQLL